MSLPRGYLSLQGLCPSGERACGFGIAQSFVENLQRYGPEWKFLNLHVVKEVLANPTVIFEGLNRMGYNSGYVYSGRYSKRIIKCDHSGSIEAPPHPDFVGIVIVNPDHRGNIILDWNWRKEDLDRPGYPENWSQDFEGIKWSKA